METVKPKTKEVIEYLKGSNSNTVERTFTSMSGFSCRVLADSVKEARPEETEVYWDFARGNCALRFGRPTVWKKA